MTTAHASPAETAAWLRAAATELTIRAATELDDTWDLHAISESLDALAEQLDPQQYIPTADAITAHLTEWAKVPTSFAETEREQEPTDVHE